MDDKELLVRVDANVKFLREKITTHFIEYADFKREVNRRVSFLEKSFWVASGVLAVVGGVAGLSAHILP